MTVAPYSYTFEDAILYNEKTDNLVKMDFGGAGVPQIVDMNLLYFDRQTTLDVDVFGVIKANQEFMSPYSGFLGIAPYTALPKQDRHRSFLWQLKDRGIID